MLSPTLGRWWECWSRISHSNHHQCQKAGKKTQNMFENYQLTTEIFLPFCLFQSIFLEIHSITKWKIWKIMIEIIILWTEKSSGQRSIALITHKNKHEICIRNNEQKKRGTEMQNYITVFFWYWNLAPSLFDLAAYQLLTVDWQFLGEEICSGPVLPVPLKQVLMFRVNTCLTFRIG